ncbi:MAG: Coenzyme F420 hydrogenase/dehydrogenase, beta subunit C-terminal domain [Ruminococcus sp.]
MGYLESKRKEECFGCEACVQACRHGAICMQEDEEGFRYPVINPQLCTNCSLCSRVCPFENMPKKHSRDKYAYGGYILDSEKRFSSTSGGAFSAIADAYCDENFALFGAEAKGLDVFHSFVTSLDDIHKLRKSKYSQSVIGNTYSEVKAFLKEGKKVLFAGTPCQIAGLKAFLGSADSEKLLTVEVICEGVPSPLYIRKYADFLESKFASEVHSLDYRYTGKSFFGNGKWDFEIMNVELKDKSVTTDRWFNPFWSVWLKHLMSRPSCYECPFAEKGRVADISLGDLWGVHLYCPELYGKNGGASLVVCNTEKGKAVFKKAQSSMFGHELLFEDALKYQSPMRKHIDNNPDRGKFMKDLQTDIDYNKLNKKWAEPPTPKLLWQKYIWGNRQKVWLYSITHRKKQKAEVK